MENFMILHQARSWTRVPQKKIQLISYVCLACTIFLSSYLPLVPFYSTIYVCVSILHLVAPCSVYLIHSLCQHSHSLFTFDLYRLLLILLL